MPEQTQLNFKSNPEKKKERQCIVLGYGGKDYWDGTATYSSDFNNTKIFSESEVPSWVKDHYDHKIVYLDTKEGLALLFKEYENLQHFVKIQEPRVNDAKKAMDKLWNNSKELREYIGLHNKWYNPLIEISEDQKERLLEEVVKNQ